MTPIRTLRPLAKVVLSTQSDERLVTLARAGSEDAFAEIVRRHRPGLMRLARSLGTGDRADDVVQDGLVRAWRALQRTDAEIDLRPWLTTIVRNRALTSHSTNRVHEELDETIDGVRQPGDIVIMREELRSAVSAVNSLPESQREALVRSALAGESHDQIASALATTPGAVRQLIFRARTGLREAVGALVPFPLVRALAELSAGGAAAGGTAAALTTGGVSLGLKALAVVVVGATIAGGGVAIQRHTSGAEAKELDSTTTEATGHPVDAAAAHAPAAANPSTAVGARDTGQPESVAQVVQPAKSSEASRSSTLATSDSRETGSPRIADNTATGAENHQTSEPDSTPPQQQQQPQPAPGGHHDQPPDQGGPPQSGGGQQQPPPPPPPPGETVPTGEGTDGHHPDQTSVPQPQPTDGHDGHHDGAAPGAVTLPDLTLGD